MSRFTILKCVDVCNSPTGNALGKFFIVEVYHSSDGPRTRLCDLHCDTLEQAQARVAIYQEIST